MAGRLLAVAALGGLLGLWTGSPAAQPAGGGAPVYESFLDLPDPTTVEFAHGLDSDDLIGGDVVAPDGSRIGTITDLLVGPGRRIENVALDPGSVLGAGSRHVTVAVDRLRPTEAGAGTLVLDTSAQELRGLTTYRQVDNRWEPIP